ncbi:hypothetical protein H0R90_03500 [Treponema putidum]|uniref:hypothetical protein n=1 Tax=Treponema putidum TaxID=221027 RepID=UPI0011995AF0|nr:hypothetical protein [Treponema putidum]TWI78905.1 hypothetical protein JM98_00489 [Treponema putidum]
MVNWKNSYHLMEGDDFVLGLGGDVVVNSTRGVGFNINDDEPHVVPEEGNGDSGTGSNPAVPSPGTTTPEPADSTTSSAPSGTGSAPSEPANDETGQDAGHNTAGETDIPSNGGSGTGSGNSGDGSNYYDDHNSVYDNYDDEDDYHHNHQSNESSDSGAGNTALSGTSPSSSSNEGTGVDQAPLLNSNNAGNSNETPAAVSPRDKGKAALLNFSQWELDNLKAANKNDMLAVYYDDKVTKKKLSFDEVISERWKNLPMQKDKNGNVIYPNACHYDSVVGAVNLAGHNYKADVTKERAEKMANDAISDKGNKLYTDVIKEVFGVDAVYYEIPKGISLQDLKTLVGDNPAMIKFPQRDFWGNDTLPEDGQHAIGYASGGFIDPYMGRHGEQWEDVRGSSSTADFTSNLGGFYFKIKK